MIIIQDHHIIIICLSIDERTMGIVICTISFIPKYPTRTERFPLPCHRFRHGYFEYYYYYYVLLCILSDSKFCPLLRTIPNSPLPFVPFFRGGHLVFLGSWKGWIVEKWGVDPSSLSRSNWTANYYAKPRGRKR